MADFSQLQSAPQPTAQAALAPGSMADFLQPQSQSYGPESAAPALAAPYQAALAPGSRGVMNQMNGMNNQTFQQQHGHYSGGMMNDNFPLQSNGGGMMNGFQQ